MANLKLDENLLKEIEKDPHFFVGKIIDISEAPDSLSSHLNAPLASSFGVTKKEMSVQVAENLISEIAKKAKIEVVCLFKDQITDKPRFVEQMKEDRIVLLE